RALSRVEHPNVVRIFDVGEAAGGWLFYAMELLKGGKTLADVVIQEGCPTPERLVEIARDVLAGLSAIHAQGIVHRDVKPPNLLIQESGRCVIIDFSIARLPDASFTLTKEGFVIGTPTYMAPEQILGK